LATPYVVKKGKSYGIANIEEIQYGFVIPIEGSESSRTSEFFNHRRYDEGNVSPDTIDVFEIAVEIARELWR
jgi:hypothetical protein